MNTNELFIMVFDIVVTSNISIAITFTVMLLVIAYMFKD